MIDAETLAKRMVARAQTRLGGSPDVHRHGFIYVNSWERLDATQRQAWIEVAEEAMSAVRRPPTTMRDMACPACGLRFTEEIAVHTQDSGVCPRCTTGAQPLTPSG